MTAHLAPPQNWNALLPADVTTRSLAPGETLLAPGEQPKQIWLIHSGSVRSLAALPPQNHWRTVERHGEDCFVGWLGWLHGRPMEHLRAAEASEVIELSLEQFEQLWQSQPALRHWCADQTPMAEALYLLLQLSHGSPARSHQLDDWRSVQPSLQWAIDAAPESRPGGKWHWISGAVWPERPSDSAQQQRLIWLPDPDDSAIQLGLRELGPPPRNQHEEGPLRLKRASGPRDIPLATAKASHPSTAFLATATTCSMKLMPCCSVKASSI